MVDWFPKFCRDVPHLFDSMPLLVHKERPVLYDVLIFQEHIKDLMSKRLVSVKPNFSSVE